MYAEPITWDVYECAVDEIIRHNSKHFDDPLDDDEMTRLSLDGIRAQVAGLSIVHEPNLFSASVSDRATISHLCMALGSTTVNDAACSVFEGQDYGKLLALTDLPSVMYHVAGGAANFRDVSAISVGRTQGVTPEHIAKIWRIPFDDAVRTLEATTQLIKQNPESSLSRNADTNDRAVRYRRLDSTFFTNTMFATKLAKSLRGNTCVQVFFSDKDYMTVIPMTKG
jgi:hypothetical protein